jgi:hypothetical protein
MSAAKLGVRVLNRFIASTNAKGQENTSAICDSSLNCRWRGSPLTKFSRVYVNQRSVGEEISDDQNLVTNSEQV